MILYLGMIPGRELPDEPDLTELPSSGSLCTKWQIQSYFHLKTTVDAGRKGTGGSYVATPVIIHLVGYLITHVTERFWMGTLD